MKLFKSTTSPFARLAEMSLIEAGADYEPDLLNPWEDPDRLVKRNPARRVPTLELDDGTILTEAMLIHDYARQIAPEGSHLKDPLTPVQLEIAGRAFGVMEAAVYVMAGRKIMSDTLADTTFDEEHKVAERRRKAMIVGLKHLDGMTGELSTDKLRLPELLVVDAVEYMDFRFPDSDWRPEIANLDAFVKEAHAHKSVDTTFPKS